MNNEHESVTSIITDFLNPPTNEQKHRHSKGEKLFHFGEKISYVNSNAMQYKIVEMDLITLLGAGVLGDGLGTLRHGVLGELSREKQSDSGLDLARGDGGPLVVVSQTAGLGSDSLEEIVDERVHDGHRLRRYSSVRMDLLQHLQGTMSRCRSHNENTTL